MARVNVNNGYQAEVSFPFGWSGTVGVLELPDGRVQIAYQSKLAPPIGYEMILPAFPDGPGVLLTVRHVSRGDLFTTITLMPKGRELP
jgi:hypothetical protein